MPTFTEKINEQMPSMTKSHKIVASHYLEGIDKYCFYTLDEVAHEIGVSTTTVLRFARILGYSGFTEMQKDIQEELLNKISLPERLSALQKSSDTMHDQLLISSMQSDIDDITKTMMSLDPNLLERAIKAINGARSIYVLGMRSSFALAHFMGSRLAQIRPHVHIIDAGGMLYPEEFSGASQEDLLIAFTFPRFSSITCNLLSYIKGKGIPVLMITAPDHPAIEKFADIILPCYISSISFKNSITAPIALINYIVAAVALEDKERSLQMVQEIEQFLNTGNYIQG